MNTSVSVSSRSAIVTFYAVLLEHGKFHVTGVFK